MASIVGRLTGKPAACLSTLGPGATNFTTAAAYAHLGGFPMVILTGQKPIRESKQGHFQIVDVVSLFRPITKFTKQIVEPSTVPYLVRDCVRISMEEKPGPVCTSSELPEDRLQPYVIRAATPWRNRLQPYGGQAATPQGAHPIWCRREPYAMRL